MNELTLSNISASALRRAADIREKIEELTAELNGIFGKQTSAPPPAAAPASSRSRKRVMSPEARERIAAAQRARWAKVRREKAAK